MAVDLSSGLAALGAGFDSLNSGIQGWQKRSALAALGDQLQAGDYEGAAQKAFKIGDVSTGLGILKLKADKEGDAAALGLLGGGTPNPTASATPPTGAGGATAAVPGDAGSAIASIESGGSGNYAALGPVTKSGDRAYGRYQIMGANIPQWTQAALGRSLTPEQFAADPAAQDATFKHRFGQYVAKYGPEGAARAWFAGEGGMNNPNARDQLGTSVADYSRKFTAAYNPGSGTQVASNNPGFVPQGSGATAYAPGVTPAPAEPTITDEDYGGPQSGSSAISTAANGAPASPPAPVAALAPTTTDSPDRQALITQQNNLTRAMVSARSEGAKTAIKLRLDQVKTALDKLDKDADKEKWTTIPQSDFAKYGIPPDYKGPVLRNVNGDIKAPMKPTTEVNIQQKAEGAYDQEVAKQYAKTYGDIQEAGRNSVSEVNTLKYMQRIVDDPSFYSGTGGPVATQAKRALSSLGITDAKDAAPNELFEKLSNKAILDAAGGSLGAGISNADRDFIARTTANTGNTKEGNRQILAVGLAVAQRKADLAKLARDYAKSNGGRLDMGFDQKLSEWAEKNPLFPQAAQQPGPTQPQPQGGGKPQVAPTEALSQAREAISRGAPREAVIQRLRQNGIDTSGL